MRIALLNPTYWPEVRRGAERLVHDLAVALRRAGHDVTVLTTHTAARACDSEEGCRVVRRHRPRDPFSARWSYGPHLMSVPGLMAELRSGSFDVAHAFHPADGWGAVMARRLGGPPVVVSLLGIPTRPWLRGARHRQSMLEQTMDGAEVTTVLSEAALKPLRRYLLRDAVVLSGAVESEDYMVEEPRASAPTLLCAASLNDPRKRGELLLAAFDRVRGVLPNARLLLAGRRDPMLRDMTLAWRPGVEFIEADEVEKLARAYASAWASVLAAVDEAFGLVLIESLAAGTPVVAARSGGVREIVTRPDIGRLFEPDDENDLVRALLEGLVPGPDSLTAETCQKYATKFDWSVVLGEYEQVYAQAASSAAGAGPRRR